MPKHISKQESATVPTGLLTMMPPMNGAMEALAKAGQTIGEGAAKCQRELAEFLFARLKADMDMQTAIAGCRDMNDLARLQQKWATAAARDYADEGRKLAEIGTDTMRNSMASWLHALQHSTGE